MYGIKVHFRVLDVDVDIDSPLDHLPSGGVPYGRGAAAAVKQPGADADHARRCDVVGGHGLLGAGAAHAANDLDVDDGKGASGPMPRIEHGRLQRERRRQGRAR